MIRPPGSRGPSAGLPLTYLGAAALAFVLAALSLPWLAGDLAGHYYQPRVLALTHTVTLGWITLTILGASYQLIPVVLERPLWSERLARWQFVLLVAGIAGMVGHFWIGHWSGLVWGAALVGLGALAHLANTTLTMRGVSRWTFTARLVALALAGFGLTALLGLLLGADKLWRFLPGHLFGNLHAHVHLALLGWVLPMVIGVAARLYPMFLLAREPDGWPGRVQLSGLGLGVPAVVLGLLLGAASLSGLGALAVAAAVAGHLAWLWGMARDRKRPTLDWGLRFALTGAGYLVAATALGLGFALGLWSGPRAGLAYAAFALGGWATLTIAGMMLKIVPFLVWYRAYAPLAGRRPVPAMSALGRPRVEGVAYALLTVGFGALAVALASGHAGAIRASGLVVAAGALAFATALGSIFCHLKPRRAGVPEPPAREATRERVPAGRGS